MRKRARAVVCAAGLLLVAPGPGGSAENEVAAAEALVRADYFEGVPYERARAISAAGAARLEEMLADPAETAHHAKIAIALGISAHPGAYEALADYAAREPQGRVDHAVFEARLAIPVAMGHLAREDDRALAFLQQAAALDPRAAAPAWSYGHFRGAGLAAMIRARAVLGLGMSGRPEARETLRRIEARAVAAGRAAAPAPGEKDAEQQREKEEKEQRLKPARPIDPRLQRRARAALELSERIAARGPAHVFSGPGARRARDAP